MALSPDQRAAVELLLEAGQTYEEIATTLGVEEAEIRRRGREALAALGAGEITADSDLVDLLLGQLPAGSTKLAVDRLEGDPAKLAEARRVAALLRLAVPGGSVPELPRPGGQAQPATEEAAESEDRDTGTGDRDYADHEPPSSEPFDEAVKPAPPKSRGYTGRGHEPAVAEPVQAPESAPSPAEPAAGLDRGQKRLLATLFGAAFVVVAVVLAVSGVFGSESEDQDGETTAANESTVAEDPADAEDPANVEDPVDPEQLTRALLTPRGGSNAQGEALFGTLDGEQPALLVVADGLEPTGEGEEYNVWLMRDDQSALRVAATPVDRDGTLEAQVEIPGEVLAFVADGELSHIDISRATEQAFQQELRRSAQQDRLTRHVGRTVLRGPITGPGLTPDRG